MEDFDSLMQKSIDEAESQKQKELAKAREEADKLRLE